MPLPSNTKKRSFVDDPDLANRAALYPIPLKLSQDEIACLEDFFLEAKGVSLKLISPAERVELGVSAKTLRTWWVRRATAEKKRPSKLRRRESAPSPPTSPRLSTTSPSRSPPLNAYPTPYGSTAHDTPKPEVEVFYPAPVIAPEQPQHRPLLPRHLDLLPSRSPLPHIYNPAAPTFDSGAGPLSPFALIEVEPLVERRFESPVVDAKRVLRMMERLVEEAVQEEKGGRTLSEDELYDCCRLGVNEVEDVVFLSAFQLSIGSWHRLLERERPELMVYFLPSVESFVFWTHHNDLYFKVSLPVSSIRSLHIFRDARTDEASLLFTRDLSSPITFHTSFPGTLTWDRTRHDWTMDSQASRCETWTVLVSDAMQAIQAIQSIAKLLRGTTHRVTRTADPGRAFLEKIWYGAWNRLTTTTDDLVESIGFPRCALTGRMSPKDDATDCELEHPRGFDPIRIRRVLAPPSKVVPLSEVYLRIEEGVARVIKAQGIPRLSTPFGDLSEFDPFASDGRRSPVLAQESSAGWVRADSPGIDETISTPYSPSPPSPRRFANFYGPTASPSLPNLSRSGSASTEAEGSFVDSPFSQSAPMFEDCGSQEVLLGRMWAHMRQEGECGATFSVGAKEDPHHSASSLLSFEADIQASFPSLFSSSPPPKWSPAYRR